ncbi:hypothetical protein BMS3Bbin06_01850 [bacterium BMS3Bbin06]|nr:hypothetical protein BMS3Abin08_00404 [bacterium BMS3Abin08]GBE35312.1 hypothetical protein BMS3Bbin06_01850 [bacterium BMS3Bbin06]HDO34948.1 copper chaperone PCu(A)C [Nitrospirota bacterium]HDY71190.1 copper chaperone PCu(A)C [Nitrospirota bacterium]
MRKKSLFIILIPFLFTLILLSCKESGPPEIKIKWPELFIGNREASAFMVILNDGTGKDRLTGCSIQGYPEVVGELHDVVNGRMQMVEEFVIPAGGVLELKPGALHLMFFGLPEEIGDEVTIVLKFQKSGKIKVKAKVKHY